VALRVAELPEHTDVGETTAFTTDTLGTEAMVIVADCPTQPAVDVPDTEKARMTESRYNSQLRMQ
jgi:hypothetical protein